MPTSVPIGISSSLPPCNVSGLAADSPLLSMWLASPIHSHFSVASGFVLIGPFSFFEIRQQGVFLHGRSEALV